MGFKTKHLQREEVKMADNVSFKVYLKDPSQGEELEVRRFVVDKEVSTSLVYIKEKLVSIFPILADKIFSVSWTDEDGDAITIDTDEELILALTELPGPVYKLTATVRAAKKVEEPQEPGVGANMTHHGVTCDGCDKAPIVGFRYKCVVCDDYDLCAACEKAGKHPGHNMMRISSPEVIWPQRLFKRILLVSTCRWMSRLQEGRGPLSSHLPRPTRQKRRTSRTRLLVLKQQRRGLPLHLTMRNGLYSPTRNPRLRPFRFRSRCWTRR